MIEETRKTREHLMQDRRTRAMVAACVAAALNDIKPRASFAAHDAAWLAAELAIAMIYRKDGELAQLRAERDEYRRRAIEQLNLAPTPGLIIVPKP